MIPLLVGAVHAHPVWATLARGVMAGYDDETLRAAVTAFLTDVAALYAEYGAVTDS